MKTETNLKTKEPKSKKPKTLAEIADRFKDKVLFPEQVERARKLLQNATIIKR